MNRLNYQGLDLQSVVEKGRVLQLRGAANVSLGGTTWDVTCSAHPDNLALASHAARALRLDLAGVDLLLPDISRSWKETGGTICEVNAQPQFSATSAHLQVLQRLMVRQGRIPVVGWMEGRHEIDWAGFASQLTALHGMRLIVVRTAEECNRALMDSQADALLWLMQGKAMSSTWWPVDRLDLFVVCSESTDQFSDAQEPPHVERWSANEGDTDLDERVLLGRLFAFLTHLTIWV